MSELVVQTLYAIFATLAFALAVVTVVGDNFPKLNRKPFSCIYCMTVWCAPIVCVYTFGFTVEALMVWPVAHIGAYIAYQKLI